MLHTYLNDPHAPIAAAVFVGCALTLLGGLAYALLESGSTIAARMHDRRRAKARDARYAARAKRLGLVRPSRY